MTFQFDLLKGFNSSLQTLLTRTSFQESVFLWSNCRSQCARHEEGGIFRRVVWQHGTGEGTHRHSLRQGPHQCGKRVRFFTLYFPRFCAHHLSVIQVTIGVSKIAFVGFTQTTQKSCHIWEHEVTKTRRVHMCVCRQTISDSHWRHA